MVCSNHQSQVRGNGFRTNCRRPPKVTRQTKVVAVVLQISWLCYITRLVSNILGNLRINFTNSFDRSHLCFISPFFRLFSISFCWGPCIHLVCYIYIYTYIYIYMRIQLTANRLKAQTTFNGSFYRLIFCRYFFLHCTGTKILRFLSIKHRLGCSIHGIFRSLLYECLRLLEKTKPFHPKKHVTFLSLIWKF